MILKVKFPLPIYVLSNMAIDKRSPLHPIPNFPFHGRQSFSAWSGVVSGESHSSMSSGFRITGIRSWYLLIHLFGSHVSIVDALTFFSLYVCSPYIPAIDMTFRSGSMMPVNSASIDSLASGLGLVTSGLRSCPRRWSKPVASSKLGLQAKFTS